MANEQPQNDAARGPNHFRPQPAPAQQPPPPPAAGPGPGPGLQAQGAPAEQRPANAHAAQDRQAPPARPPVENLENTIGNIGNGTATINQAQQITYYAINIREARRGRGARRANSLGDLLHATEDDNRIYKYDQAIHATPTQAVLNNTSAPSTAISLPRTRESVIDWYRKFLPIERCFLQAIALLSGAPEHEIRRATNELYHYIYMAEWERTKTLYKESPEDAPIPEDTILHLDTLLCEKTYTTIRSGEGARRIFWKDAQSNGYSAFGLLVLEAVESEHPMGYNVGTRLLDHFAALPKVIEGESAWRIPRALGSLWLRSDETKMRSIAADWMEADSMHNWQVGRAAYFLEGAYEVEYEASDQKAQIVSQSTVLGLLQEWIGEAQENPSAAIREKVACTIADTYKLIGIKCLPAAFQALDQLVSHPTHLESASNGQLPETDNLISENVIIAIATSYVTLARFGSVRVVLQHLSEQAVQLSFRRNDRQARNRPALLIQRALTLILVFNSFTLLAAEALEDTAFTNTRDLKPKNYPLQGKIRDEAHLHDDDGRDLLLASILTCDEPEYQRYIMDILASLLINELLEDKNIEIAFDILHEWTIEVLKEKSLLARATYLQFMKKLILQADRWNRELDKKHYATRRVLEPAKRKLQEWKPRSGDPPHSISAFVNDLLHLLNL